jgi:hypothetical protein
LRAHRAVRSWLWTSALVTAMNACFFLMLLLAATLPVHVLQERVIEAFQDNALSLRDRLPFDTGAGWHQYNDCLILQMVSNPDRPLHKAIGPLVYHRPDFADFCSTVSDLLVNRVSAADLQEFRYTRYWHGHNALTGGMLYLWSVSELRRILTAGAYLSLVALAAVAWRQRSHARVLGLAFAVHGTLFWGLPYFAQSPSHGPGDIVVVSGFVVLLWACGRGVSRHSYQLLCAAFGAVLTYMEFLTGLLPTAAAFLVPVGYFAAVQAPGTGSCGPWRFALAGGAAFVLGVLLTVLIKQALALALLGPETIGAFTNNLVGYAQAPGVATQSRLVVAVETIVGSIRRWGRILTYGNQIAALLLFTTGAMMWGAALALACWTRSRDAWNALAVCVTGAAVILVWVVALPSHTVAHEYMVRIMIAPLALGWTAVIVQVLENRSVRETRQ